jgi:hypothetical protein
MRKILPAAALLFALSGDADSQTSMKDAAEYRLNRNDRVNDVCITYDTFSNPSSRFTHCTYFDNGQPLTTVTRDGILFSVKPIYGRLLKVEGYGPMINKNEWITKSDPRFAEYTEKHREAERRIMRPENMVRR